MSTFGKASSPSFVLHEPSREVRNGSARIRLQEQPFQILRLLLARPGAVISREEMREQLWPEGTFVDYEHSLNAAVKRLRAALGDDAKNPNFIETLPRRGYRWVSAAAPRSIRLVVLPFTERATAVDGEGSDDAFGAGLTEELIAQLAQRGAGRVHVIARRSALACTGATQRASEVGASLGADYLLEGGIRRHAGRVRIAVWLVDTREEVQTWGEIYERDITEPLPAQIDVAASIAQSIVETVFASA
jgi:TolB-like protein